MNARNKRVNDDRRAVYDIERDGRFLATVEVNSEAAGLLKVLYGALQPRGKELAWEAIRAYELA